METVHELLKLPILKFIEIAQMHSYLYVILALVAAFGILGQWVLYYKCDLPGVACLVPIWNVIVFLKIMGRPAWQSLFFMIPPPIIAYVVYTGDTSMAANIALIVSFIVLIFFAIKIYVELCQCFGKNTMASYILVLIFNGFYVMYLGMSDDTEYLGPVHGPNSIKS